MAKPLKHGSVDGAGSILSTIASPSDAAPPDSLCSKDPTAARLLEKVLGSQELSGQTPFNPTKPLEYGEASREPHAGQTQTPVTSLATASTPTEYIASPKVGDGRPDPGANPGLRGPYALEDFIMREKITHFDHERIPERVVHARGSARARPNRRTSPVRSASS